MPLLGVVIPSIVAVRVYDTATDTAKTEPVDSGRTIEYEKHKDQFQCLFEQLEIQFDILVIVSLAFDETCIHSIFAAAKKVAKQVYVVPPLMARFMAVIDILPKDTLMYSNDFAIVTDADGCDTHLFMNQHTKKEFRCRGEFYREPGELVELNKLTIRPAKVIYLTFKTNPPPSVLPLPKTVPYKHVELDDFTEMLYNGGIAKAKQIAGLWEKPYIQDFAQTMLTRIGGEVTHTAKTGAKLPFKKTISKNIDAKNVKIEVHRGTQLMVVKGKLGRIISRMFLRERISFVSVELNIEVDLNGVTTVTLALPDLSKPSVVTQVSSASTAKVMKPSWKFTNVLAHVFLSSKWIYHASDGSPMEVDIEGVDEIEPGTEITPDVVKSHCEAVFTHLPASVNQPSVFILSHDGTYPATLIKAALEVIETKFDLSKTTGYVVSDIVAYTRFALRRLNYTTVDNSKDGFIALADGTDCRTIFFERNIYQGWGILDTYHESYASTSDLCHLLSLELDRRGTRTKLLLTQTAPMSLQTQMARHGVNIKRVSAFPKALVEGLLDFGDSETETAIVNKLRDFMAQIYYSDCDGEGELIELSQTPFKTVRTLQLQRNTSLVIYQKLSAFSEEKFILFQCDQIPDSLHMQKVHFTFELDSFGLLRVTTDPHVPEVNYAKKKPKPRSEIDLYNFVRMSQPVSTVSPVPRPLSNVPSSSRLSTMSLETSSSGATTVSQIAKRIKHLKNMNAEIVITCHISSPTVQIEVLNEDLTLSLIPDLNGRTKIPLFVSFAQKNVRIGFAAMHDYIEHPKSVVYDLIHILGRTTDNIKRNPRWKFAIHSLSDEDPSVAIEVDVFNHGNVLLPANFVFSCFLKAVQRLVKEKTGEKKTKFFFYVPNSAAEVQNGMKDACNTMGAFFAGGNLLKGK